MLIDGNCRQTKNQHNGLSTNYKKKLKKLRPFQQKSIFKKLLASKKLSQSCDGPKKQGTVAYTKISSCMKFTHNKYEGPSPCD